MISFWVKRLPDSSTLITSFADGGRRSRFELCGSNSASAKTIPHFSSHRSQLLTFLVYKSFLSSIKAMRPIKKGEKKEKEELSILFGLHLPFEVLQLPESAGFDPPRSQIVKTSAWQTAEGSQYSRWSVQVLYWQSRSLIVLSPSVIG